MTVISEQDDESSHFKGRGQKRPKFQMDKFDDEPNSEKIIKNLKSESSNQMF